MLDKEESIEKEIEKKIEDGEAMKEPVGKKLRRKRSTKKENIPMETLESQLRSKPKTRAKGKQKLSILEKKSTFPEGTRIVDAGYAIKMLRDTNYRFRNICEKVAYLGRGKQKYFVLEMSSWMVVKGGILFVPTRLANISLLERWERLEGYGPEGFVAFRRR